MVAKVIALLLGIVLFLAIIGASLYGYVENILKLIAHIGVFGALEIARVVGLILPFVGIILGYVG